MFFEKNSEDALFPPKIIESVPSESAPPELSKEWLC
jgi:hypothetical protein